MPQSSIPPHSGTRPLLTTAFSLEQIAVHFQEQPAEGGQRIQPRQKQQHLVPAAGDVGDQDSEAEPVFETGVMVHLGKLHAHHPLLEAHHGQRQQRRADVAGHVHDAEDGGHVLAAQVDGDGVSGRSAQAGEHGADREPEDRHERIGHEIGDGEEQSAQQQARDGDPLAAEGEAAGLAVDPVGDDAAARATQDHAQKRQTGQVARFADAYPTRLLARSAGTKSSKRYNRRRGRTAGRR